MIDIILFISGASAMRFHLPLGVALIFAAFNYPGWVIESGNVPAAIFAILLGVADFAMKLYMSPDRLDTHLLILVDTVRERLSAPSALRKASELMNSKIAIIITRISILSMLGTTIYLVGVGTATGLKDATPAPEGSLFPGEMYGRYIAQAISYSVSLAGSFFHIFGPLATLAYTLYTGLKYFEIYIRYRNTLANIRLMVASRAHPKPQVEATPEPMHPSAPVQQIVPTQQPQQAVSSELRIAKSYDAIVDGSNIAHMGQEAPTLFRLALVVRKLSELGIRWIVIVDASLKHRLPASGLRPDLAEVLTGVQKPMTEQEAFAEAIRTQRVIETPAKTDADRFILGFARRWNSIVVSNDTYSDLKNEFPDAQRRRVTCVVIGEEVVFEPDPIQTLRSLREGPEDARLSYIG